MRYFGTPTISFTDFDGNEYELIEPQEIQGNIDRLVFKFQINLQTVDELDQIAQRRNIYNKGSETAWYNIFDFNIVPIVENDYLITGLKTLNIPRV
jgi:hypothetical protein